MLHLKRGIAVTTLTSWSIFQLRSNIWLQNALGNPKGTAILHIQAVQNLH
jgi:hypothetical protein